MRFLTTIVLILSLAAGWFAWRWIEQADAVRLPAVGQPLVRFEAADVDEIQLRRTEASANLNPIDGVWHLTSPLVDRVDPNAALAIYLGLNGLVLHEIIPHRQWRDADRKLEDFGLGRRAVSLRLLGQDKQTLHSFRIGDVTPWLKDDEPTMYVQWKDGPLPEDVLVVGGNLRALLDRPFDALRARQPLHLPHPPVAITLRKGEQWLELKRETPRSPWMITKPLVQRAEPAAVDALLRALSTVEAVALLPRGPTFTAESTAARLSIVMDGAPASEPPADGEDVAFISGNYRMDAVLQTPQAGDKELLSRWSDRQYDLRLPVAVLELLQPEMTRYRSRSLTAFDPAKVTELFFRDNSGSNIPVVLRFEQGQWNVYLRDAWWPAENSRVQRALEAIAACPIQSYPTDSLSKPEDYGLDIPIRQVGFRIGEAPPMKFSFGRKDGKLYAREDESLSVYQVPDSVIGFLPDLPSAWRSRQLFSFSSVDIRQITIHRPGQPELSLRYEPEENFWLATEDEKDTSERLDIGAAANLAGTLERWSADRWLGDGASTALSALREPTSWLGITIETFLEDGSPGPLKRIRLEFAPGPQGSNFLYGRFAGEPDVFVLSAEALAKLGSDLFVSEPE
ncbi:MAG: DUF4340 domain-containing protein [Verrucomicrobiales bacterium]